jgi:hypothetical protein
MSTAVTLQDPQPLIQSGLETLLGETIPPATLQSWLAQGTQVHPNPQSGCWSSVTTEAGLIIVLTGKARLLDGQENLIATLTPGMIIGISTLFPQADWSPYQLRSSAALSFLFLPAAVLQAWMGVAERCDRLYAEALALESKLQGKMLPEPPEGQAPISPHLAPSSWPVPFPNAQHDQPKRPATHPKFRKLFSHVRLSS